MKNERENNPVNNLPSTLVCVNRPRLLCYGPAPYVIVTSIRYKIQTYKLLKRTLIEQYKILSLVILN